MSSVPSRRSELPRQLATGESSKVEHAVESSHRQFVSLFNRRLRAKRAPNETQQSSSVAVNVSGSPRRHGADAGKHSDPPRQATGGAIVPSTSATAAFTCNAPLHLTISLEEFHQQYRVTRVIAFGSAGPVCVVESLTTGPHQQRLALKVMRKQVFLRRKQVEHVFNERLALETLRSPFLPIYYGAFQSDQELCLLTELVSGGELFAHLQRRVRFEEPMARFFVTEISCALGTIHDAGWIYRDLKLENVLLDNQGHIKLVDMGFAKRLASLERTNSWAGTRAYMAPEIVSHKPYGHAVDYWALGVILFEMVTGISPFGSSSESAMVEQAICDGQWSLPDITEKDEVPLSSEVRHLIGRLLEHDPSQRLCSQSALREHAFFADIDWDRAASRSMTPPLLESLTEVAQPSIAVELSTTSAASVDGDSLFQGF